MGRRVGVELVGHKHHVAFARPGVGLVFVGEAVDACAWGEEEEELGGLGGVEGGAGDVGFYAV